MLVAALLLAAAPAGLDAAAFARGAAAVGERPSDAPALRAEPAPSASFRLGAAWRAWRNAGAAIAHDATHPTGDGGDEEVLAEDCLDERVAFAALEAARADLGMSPAEVGAAMPAIEAASVAAWTVRPGRQPGQCHR